MWVSIKMINAKFACQLLSGISECDHLILSVIFIFIYSIKRGEFTFFVTIITFFALFLLTWTLKYSLVDKYLKSTL